MNAIRTTIALALSCSALATQAKSEPKYQCTFDTPKNPLVHFEIDTSLKDEAFTLETKDRQYGIYAAWWKEGGVVTLNILSDELDSEINLKGTPPEISFAGRGKVDFGYVECVLH